MTILEALQAKVTYPLPVTLFQSLLIDAGLNPEDIYTQEVGCSKCFQLAWAYALLGLVSATNVTEGDYSISLSDRASLIRLINSIFNRWGVDPIEEKSATVKFLDDWC